MGWKFQPDTYKVKEVSFYEDSLLPAIIGQNVFYVMTRDR